MRPSGQRSSGANSGKVCQVYDLLHVLHYRACPTLACYELVDEQLIERGPEARWPCPRAIKCHANNVLDILEPMFYTLE
jgi:hypothetical protein